MYQHIVMMGIIIFCYMLWYIAMCVNHIRYSIYALAMDFRMRS